MPKTSPQLQSLRRLDEYIREQRAKRTVFWSQRPALAPGTCHAPGFKAAPLSHCSTSARCASRLPAPTARSKAHPSNTRGPSLAPPPRTVKGSSSASASAAATRIPSGRPRLPRAVNLQLPRGAASKPVGVAPQHLTRAPITGSAGPLANRTESKYALSTRELNYELTAMRAIDARAEMLDRLGLVCERVAAAMASGFGFLSSSNPTMKLFYSTVTKVRRKTMDAIEAVAAWERCVGAGRPFVHRGKPYLENLGPDMAFLDEFPFIAQRTRGSSFVSDVFLCCLTPTGIPVEPASAGELRHGGRLTAESLRLRMALKMLNHAQRRPESPSLHLPRFMQMPVQVPAKHAQKRRPASCTACGSLLPAAGSISKVDEVPEARTKGAEQTAEVVHACEDEATQAIAAAEPAHDNSAHVSGGGAAAQEALITDAALPSSAKPISQQAVALSLTVTESRGVPEQVPRFNSAWQSVGHAVDECLLAVIEELDLEDSDADEACDAGLLWVPLPEDLPDERVRTIEHAAGNESAAVAVEGTVAVTLCVVERASVPDENPMRDGIAGATELDVTDDDVNAAVDDLLEGLADDMESGDDGGIGADVPTDVGGGAREAAQRTTTTVIADLVGELVEEIAQGVAEVEADTTESGELSCTTSDAVASALSSVLSRVALSAAASNAEQGQTESASGVSAHAITKGAGDWGVAQAPAGAGQTAGSGAAVEIDSVLAGLVDYVSGLAAV